MAMPTDDQIKSQLPEPGHPYKWPGLQGTEKQVKWASSIRKNLLTYFYNHAMLQTADGRPVTKEYSIAYFRGKDEMLAIIKNSPLVNDELIPEDVRAERINSKISVFRDLKVRIERVDEIAKHDTASFWIGNRNTHPYYLDKFISAIDGRKEEPENESPMEL